MNLKHEQKPILEMQTITKNFPGVKALDNVQLNIYSGQAMALLGENGAGKSTLMKILSGVYPKDSGKILLNGQPLILKTPRDAQKYGITIIHQELNLIPELSIGENIFLGREPSNFFGKISWNTLHKNASTLLARLNIDIDPRTPIADLSVGQAQMVEIAKALSLDAEIIIMDEPTDSLTDIEVDSLFAIIKDLKSQGKALVYISHRIKEVFEICDKVTILRDGQFINESPVSSLSEEAIIQYMVGRPLDEQFPRIKVQLGKEILHIENLSNSAIHNINFKLYESEVLGIAGLMGAGRTELAKTIYGILPITKGSIKLHSEKVIINHPNTAINLGIAYVSEDRKQEGLILGMTVKENMTLSSLKKFEKNIIFIDSAKELSAVSSYINSLSIKTPSSHQFANYLSGGNQQKVSIAKALITTPKILILDEPTRGVDVGAKKEIYELINKLKQNGMSIILISSDMPEIIGLSDRILVMYEGRITGEISRNNASQEAIMKLAIGITTQEENIYAHDSN